MESGFVWGAFFGALAGALIAGMAVAAVVKRALDRRLGAHASLGAEPVSQEPAATNGERFAEIAPELVTLARSAADSAIRREELHEWHQPDLFAESEDDISQAVRAKLRRATFNVAVARSALQGAIRRHGGTLPADLRAELAAFSAALEAEDGGSPYERKRRLAAELDAVESRIRDALGTSAAA